MKKLMAIVLSLAMVLSVVVLPAAVNVSAEAPAHYVYKEGLEDASRFVDEEGEPFSKNLLLNNIGEYEPADGTHAGGISTKYAHSGTHSYEFRSQKIGWKSAYFPVGTVEQGKTYLVDLYYYVDQENTVYGNGSAGQVAIMACTGSKDNFWSENKEEAYILNKPQIWEVVHTNYIKGEWLHVSAQFTASQSRRLYIAVGTKDNSPTADIFVDDVTVQEVDANTVVMTNKKEYNHMSDQPKDFLFAGVAGQAIDYAPTRRGFEFGGWYSDPELTKPVTTYSTDVTEVYPLWMSNVFAGFEEKALPAGSNSLFSINDDTDFVYEGKQSMHVFAKSGQTVETIGWSNYGFPLGAVNAGKSYVVDFYVWLEDTSNVKYRFQPIFASANNIWANNGVQIPLSNFTSAEYRETDSHFVINYFDIQDQNGGKRWIHASYGFTVPDGAGPYVWWSMMSSGDKATTFTDMYIDNVTLTELKPTETYANCFYTYSDPVPYKRVLKGTIGESPKTIKDPDFGSYYSNPVASIKKWNDGVQSEVFTPSEVTEIAAGVNNIYAVWGEGIKVTFNPNGGFIEGDAAVPIAPDGTYSTEGTTAFRYGGKFKGWYEDAAGTKAAADTYNDDVTLYAAYDDDKSFEYYYATDISEVWSLNTDPDFARTGNNSLHYNGESRWTNNQAPFAVVKPNTKYNLDFWYYMPSATTSSIIALKTITYGPTHWPQGECQESLELDGKVTNYWFDSEKNGNITEAINNWMTGKTGSWQHASFHFTTADNSAYTNVAIVLMGLSSGQTELYVDDWNLVELGEDAVQYDFRDTYANGYNSQFYYFGVPGEDIDLVPEREDYAFRYFYTDKEDVAGSKITKYPAENTAPIYTKWGVPGSYEVTLDLDGGKYDGETTIFVTEGSPLNLGTPVKFGYDFAGWVDEEGAPVSTITNDCTVKATWSDVIGFESFYRTDKFHLGYAAHIDSTVSYNGDNSVLYQYTGETYDSPACSPVFVQPEDWAESFGQYLYYDGAYPCYLMNEYGEAPEFVPGKYFLMQILSEEPADWETGYEKYGYFDMGEFIRLTSSTTFEADKFYTTFRSRGKDTDPGVIALRSITDGNAYEINFKYKVGATTSTTVKVMAMNYNLENIWYPHTTIYREEALDITVDEADDEWHDGKIFIVADVQELYGKPANVLALTVTSDEIGADAVLWIDDVEINEIEDPVTFEVTFENAFANPENTPVTKTVLNGTTIDYVPTREGCDFLGWVDADGQVVEEYNSEITVLTALWLCSGEHQWAEEWSHDASTHWHECEVCGAKADEASHDFSTGDCECGAKSFTYGDVDGNSTVDATDLVRLKKKLAGQDVEIYPGADCTGDGNVDATDLVRLKKYLAGQPVPLGPTE